MTYYKFTSRECRHAGVEFHDGVVSDILPWNPTEGESGGIYLVISEFWYHWLTYRRDLYYVWDAEPSGAYTAYQSYGKVKCDRVRLWNRRRICEMKELTGESAQLAAVRKNGHALRYISEPTEELQLAAVQQNGRALRCISEPSEAVQLAAVQQDGRALEYIYEPTEELQLAAVQQDGYSVQYISEPSEAVQLAAVQQDGYSVQYISEPSEAVQLAAVQQDGRALEYIRRPSEAVQLAANQQISKDQ